MNKNNKWKLIIPAYTTISFLILIILVMFYMTIPALSSPHFHVSNFWGWKFSLSSKTYGLLSMFLGTIISSFGALIIAIPVALYTSIALKFYLPKKISKKIILLIKILNTTPSVIYGFFAMNIIVSLVKSLNPDLTGQSLLSGIIVLAIMIIPMLIILIVEELDKVNKYMIESAYAIGCNTNLVISKFVIPSIKQGLINSSILSLGRALGEASAVMMISGNVYALKFDKNFLINPFTTLTTTIASNAGGASSGVETSFLYVIGLVLLLMILSLNIIISFVNKEK